MSKKWKDKQNVVYPYKGILFSLKKEWSSETYYGMDETWKHYAKGNNPHKKGQIIYVSTYMR